MEKTAGIYAYHQAGIEKWLICESVHLPSNTLASGFENAGDAMRSAMTNYGFYSVQFLNCSASQKPARI